MNPTTNQIIMKNIILSIATILLFSCSKEENLTENVMLQSTEWIVKEYKLETESDSKKMTSEVILIFKESRISLFLDVNTCGTSYELINPGEIEIENLTCTFICCDSEDGDELSRFLLKMTNYQGNNSKLILSGDDGEIILKKN